MSNIIGLDQRIPIPVMEAAIKAVANDTYSVDWAKTNLELELNGKNRLAKAVTELSNATFNNKLIEFVKNNKNKVFEALQYKSDKTLVLVGLINAAFGFGYNTTMVMGKYFHVQDRISKALLSEKMSEIYAYNRSVENALYRILPMFIEAGLIARPSKGVYARIPLEPQSDIAVEIYKKSFFANNPHLPEDYPIEDSPYWEFLQ
mgnify:CR=1 FL=1